MKSSELNVASKRQRRAVLLEQAKIYSTEVAKVVDEIDYSVPESSLAAPTDSAYQHSLKRITETLQGARHVILVGIGGSSLGAEAVYAALKEEGSPQLTVFDTIDEASLQGLMDSVSEHENPNELAVIVVSKSGKTTETITNAVYVMNALETHYGEVIHSRTVCVGSEASTFLSLAQEKGIKTAVIPEAIGGRFSVFTAAGVVPLRALGIDVDALLSGATEALSGKARTRALKHAVSLVGLAEEGVHTVNFFTFEKRFLTLGHWFRQLLAESIGKKETKGGAPFAFPLLPTVASSVDLHSMAQLYLSGYDGLFTHFVSVEAGQGVYEPLSDHWLAAVSDEVRWHAPRAIEDAIQQGVFAAYDEASLPYRRTRLADTSAYELGLFMGSLMFEVMCLGHLFHIDTFNQPNVERYKVFTKEHLEN